MKTIRRNASLRLATIWVLIGLYFEPLQAQIITSGWGLTGPRELRTRSAVAHPSGGYVLIGEFTDTLAVGSFTLGLPADGRKDAFVLRVDANGQVIWGRAFSGVGTRDAKPGDVACAPTGEIFVSGEVEGDLRQGTDTLPNISTAKKSLYLAAFDALGNRLWWTRETTATTNSELEPKGGLAVTASAVYLAGMLKKSTASYGSFALSNPNNKGVGFIATWSLSGVLQNAHTVVQAGNEGGEINSIGAHPSGLYLAGKVNKVSGTLGHGTTLPIPNTTNNDVEFFAALDFNLGAVWVRTLASSNNKIKSVRVASYPGGGLIGSGEFEQTADFGGLTLIAGTKKAGYVVRFSATGVPIWVIGTTQSSVPSAAEAKLDYLAVSPDGVVYAGGELKGPVGYDTVPQVFPQGTAKAVHVLRVDTTGRVRWVRLIPSTGDVELAGLVSRSAGDLTILGTYRADLTVGDSLGTLMHDNSGIRGTFALQTVTPPKCPDYVWETYVQGCQGDIVELDAFSDGAVYLWSNGATTPRLDVTASGQYWVEATRDGCTRRDTVDVILNPLPIVNLGDTAFLCQGQLLTLNAGNPGATYLWNLGNSSRTITITQPGTYWVEVTNFGCTTRDTVVVDVTPAPVVDLGSDQVRCMGEVLTLDAGNPGLSYLWNTGQTTQTIEVTSDGAYWVAVSNALCTTRDTILVSFTPVLEANLEANYVHCAGASSLLTAAPGADSYLWSTGETTQSITVSAAGSYWVELRANNCTSTDTALVSVTPLPVVDLGPDRARCNNENLTLDAQNPGATYAWSTGATGRTLSVPAAGGTFWVTVTLSGCSATDTVVLTPADAPNLVLTGPDTLDVNKVGTFSASSQTAGAIFDWDFGPNATPSTATGPGPHSVRFGANGSQAVRLTVTSREGCSNEATANIIVQGTNHRADLQESLVRVYPNPSSGLINLAYPALDEAGLLRVLSPTGQEVLRQPLLPGSQQTQLWIPNPGYYWVEIQQGTSLMHLPVWIH